MRKRLAQYYYDAVHHQELRIELNPGSYIPEFKWTNETRKEAVGPPAHPNELIEPTVAIPGDLPTSAPAPRVDASLDNLRMAARLRFWKSSSAVLACVFVIAVGLRFADITRRASLVDLLWQPLTKGSARQC